MVGKMTSAPKDSLPDSRHLPENGTDTLACRPMTWRQILALVVVAGVMVVDGIDILSMGLAAPGIVAEFRVTPETLGWVLSMELIGTAIGAVILGGLADWIGRRRTILLCLVPMAFGMWGASQASSVETLLMWRLFTGLGIGIIGAAISAAAAEFSNERRRNLAVAFLVICYPIGGALAGIIGRQLLVDGTWRDVLTMGAWVTAAFVPLVWILVPETIPFLDRKQPAGALDKINRTLKRLGHPTVPALKAHAITQRRVPLFMILTPRYLRVTAFLTIAAIAHITSLYFALKWAPKIVVDLGFAPGQAAGVLMWVNFGSILGGALFGIMALRLSVKWLTVGAFIGGAAMIVAFGRGAGTLQEFSLLGFMVGLFTFSGLVGLYTLLTQLFPTENRATANGFVLGVGRGVSALAPVLVGGMFGAGLPISTVAAVMSLGSFTAALVLATLRRRSGPNVTSIAEVGHAS